MNVFSSIVLISIAVTVVNTAHAYGYKYQNNPYSGECRLQLNLPGYGENAPPRRYGSPHPKIGHPSAVLSYRPIVSKNNRPLPAASRPRLPASRQPVLPVARPSQPLTPKRYFTQVPANPRYVPTNNNGYRGEQSRPRLPPPPPGNYVKGSAAPANYGGSPSTFVGNRPPTPPIQAFNKNILPPRRNFARPVASLPPSENYVPSSEAYAPTVDPVNYGDSPSTFVGSRPPTPPLQDFNKNILPPRRNFARPVASLPPSENYVPSSEAYAPTVDPVNYGGSPSTFVGNRPPTPPIQAFNKDILPPRRNFARPVASLLPSENYVPSSETYDPTVDEYVPPIPPRRNYVGREPQVPRPGNYLGGNYRPVVGSPKVSTGLGTAEVYEDVNDLTGSREAYDEGLSRVPEENYYENLDYDERVLAANGDLIGKGGIQDTFSGVGEETIGDNGFSNAFKKK